MELNTLIEFLTDASAPTVLAVLLGWALWNLKDTQRGRIEDLKDITKVMEANALQMERLTTTIERRLDGKG